VGGTGYRPAAVRLEAQDGTRRYRRAFVWIARKNGKTELAAGIALLGAAR
jgi:phage terminase large subunit-like protein